MKVIKYNTYNIINPEPFEIPFPTVFELLSGNTLLAEYTISDAGVVDYSFNPSASERILTSIRRPLSINDIYFLFTSRIFPDKTPYTAIEMERFDIEEYHPYAIIRKTRGMLPGDKYWFRFENENINYKAALHEHRAYYENSYKRYLDSLEAEKPAEEPLVQSELGSIEATAPAESPAQSQVSDADVDTMSEDMINSLMNSFGADGESQGGTMFEPDSGSHDRVSDDAIAAMLAANTTPEPASGEKLSDEAIAAMLAQTKADNGIEGKMSDDEIAALLAANGVGEPEPAPAPVAEESSGGNMSPEAIAAMLAANTAPEPEPAPVAEESSGGNMSPEAIAAMLAANATPEPEPAPVAEESSGGNMSPEAIAAMLAANQ